MTFARKTLTASLAALTLSATVIVSSAPASAAGRGFSARSVHSFGGHGALRRPTHGHGHGYGWRGAAALGFGALALGAVASAATYAPECSIERRPVVDSWGRIVGYKRVRFCD